MGRFDTTKATIDANIKQNGNQEITGSILNSVMTEMVDATDAQLTELSNEIKEGAKKYQAKLIQGKGIQIEDNTISVLVDSDLSVASTNPVQNKVITAELEKKVEEQDVKSLIFQEHAYLKYIEDDGIVYFKGFTTPNWEPLLYWQFNAIVGKPLTFHFTIVTTKGENSLSTNKFEVYAAGLDSAYMTWVFGGLKYTLEFYNGEQIITTEAYEEGGSYDDTEIRQELTELSEEVEHQGIFLEDLQNTKIDRENDDYYPKMAVGLADNLVGVDVVDSEINFRRSGGGAISDGVARVQSIKGNSAVWNQQNNPYLTDYAKQWFSLNGNFYTTKIEVSEVTWMQFSKSMNLKAGHYYFNLYTTKAATSGFFVQAAGQILKPNVPQIVRLSEASSFTPSLRLEPGNVGVTFSLQAIDLTQMFGAGNEPTTIEEFNTRIPQGVDLNAYSEGEVIHMDVQSIESQGVNAWDEEWRVGRFDTTTGAYIPADVSLIGSKNLIKVLPNTQYCMTFPKGYGEGCWMMLLDENGKPIEGYSGSSGEKSGNSFNVSAGNPFFATTSETAYAQFYLLSSYGTTYKGDICINLSDTAVNGKYFPHIKRVEDLAVIRKYFPNGMRSAGTAHDEIRYNKASEKWEKVQRIGEVNLGSLVWSYNSTSGQERFYAFGVSDLAPIKNDGTKANLLCAKYDTKPFSEIFAHIADKIIGMHSSGQVVIYDSAYTDATSFKAAMQGVMLYYELAEPIVTELDEVDQFKDLDYPVWNAGTEKAIAEGKSTPLSADITYGFNAPAKIKENAAQIKENANEIAKLKQSSGSTTTYKTINGTSVVGSGNIDTHYPISSSTASALTIQPNTYYKWSGATLNVTLGSTDANLCEFVIELAVTGTPSITFPSSVKWANGIAPTFVSGKSYIVSIVNNLGVYAAF